MSSAALHAWRSGSGRRKHAGKTAAFKQANILEDNSDNIFLTAATHEKFTGRVVHTQETFHWMLGKTGKYFPFHNMRKRVLKSTGGGRSFKWKNSSYNQCCLKFSLHLFTH